MIATSVTVPFYWWIQPTVTAFAALCGGLFAAWTISANRRIARTRATLDLIERTESQQFYQQLWESFRAAREKPDGFAQLLNPTTQELQEQQLKVFAFLNHYELIAVGCRHGVLDKEFYKNWMRSAVIRDWLAAADFINGLRNPTGEPLRPTLFEHFEALATGWIMELEIDQATTRSR